MSATDLPEAAAGRLRSGAFASSLSIPDFAACLGMGLRPLGLVQGFCVMGWRLPISAGRWSGGGGWGGWTLLRRYDCPHGYGYHDINEDPNGYTLDATSMATTWSTGFGAALDRMLEEAALLGADGVVGVVDSAAPLIGEGVREFHVIGTAVAAGPAPSGSDDRPWSTYLAGAKLAKLFEAGLAPVTVTAAYAHLRAIPGCRTEILEAGGWDPTGRVRPGSEVEQLSELSTWVRRQVRDQVRSGLGGGSLHGAELEVGGDGGQRTAVLRGTVVRRAAEVAPPAPPLPTVRLS